jgi:hypothetical protein
MRQTLQQLDDDVRRTRLSELALSNIDLIDRNIYERSCDVRWWATDAAIVDCATTPSPERAAHAAARLGVILDAYTVYLDLWLCSPDGIVLAHGPARALPRRHRP